MPKVLIYKRKQIDWPNQNIQTIKYSEYSKGKLFKQTLKTMNGAISFKRHMQKPRTFQQNDYLSQQKHNESKSALKRMNSLKTFDVAFSKSHQKSNHANRQTTPQRTHQSGKFKDTEHQKLTNKLYLIEQKVLEMKNDLMKKKQQKQTIIQQQVHERERRHKQRQVKAKFDHSEKQNKKQKTITLEERINTIPRNRVKQQYFFNGPILEQRQSSIIENTVTRLPQPKEIHQLTQNPYSPRSNIYYVSQVIKTYQNNKSLAKQHLVQSLQIMRTLQNSRMPSSTEVDKKKLNLVQKKQHQGKKTLIFDLDETLIHCNDSLSKRHDVKIGIRFDNGTIVEAGVNIRPYAKQILRNLHKDFEIIIFTASQSCYADEVLKVLDPHKEYISHRLYREHCLLSSEGMYIKDLRIINRPMSHIILVDNAAYSYFFQLENGIPIIPYYNGSLDFELKELENYLRKLVLESDVRRMNKNVFQLHRYCEYYNTPNKLVEELYVNRG